MTEIPKFPESLADIGGRDLGTRVHGQLFDRRIVVLSGRLDESSAGSIAAQLMALDALGDGAITLRLSSTGGSIDAAMAVMDVIDALGVPVHATALGLLEGPSVGVLAISGRRTAGQHVRIRLDEDAVVFEGTARLIEAWATNHAERLGAFAERIARRARRTSDGILEDLVSSRYLSALEAKEYGLIDEIAGRDAAILDLRRSTGLGSLGFHPSQR